MIRPDSFQPLTTNERKALTILASSEWENPAQLYVGRQTTIAGLLEKGFVEFLPNQNKGYEKIRITLTGREALASLVPEKPKRKHKLKMAEPRIKAADFGLGSYTKKR